MATTEPVCTEIVASASVGGKVQIVKFEYTADFHYSMSRKYSVPEDWTEAQIDIYQRTKNGHLRAEVEEQANKEMADLLEQREELNK